MQRLGNSWISFRQTKMWRMNTFGNGFQKRSSIKVTFKILSSSDRQSPLRGKRLGDLKVILGQKVFLLDSFSVCGITVFNTETR